MNAILDDGERYVRALDAELLRKGRQASSANLERMRIVEANTNKEAERGFIGPPMPASELMRRFGSRIRPLKRFGVLQGGKTRCCDDGKAAGTNAATCMLETVALPSAIWPIAAAACVNKECAALGIPSEAVQLGLDDMTAAYRQVPVNDPSLTIVAYFAPSTGRVQFRHLRGHNFGLKAAVINFSSVSAFIASSGARLLALLIAVYIDDFMIVDLKRAGEGGQRAFASFVRLLKYTLDAPKRLRMAPRNKALGVLVDLASAHISGVCTLSPTPERVADMSEKLREVISRGYFLNTEADTVLGRLGFLATTSFSKVGRAANAPLRIVANDHRNSDWSAVIRCLSFMLLVLSTIGSKEVSTKPGTARRFARIYTDASFSGLGIVILIEDASYWTSSHVDADLMDRWSLTDIGGLEALAAVCGRHFLTTVAPDVNDFVIYVDNMEVASNLVSGYSSRECLVCLMLEFYLIVASRPGRLWIEWVPTAANIADIPSRHPGVTCLSHCSQSPMLKAIFAAENFADFVFPTHSSLWTALPPMLPVPASMGGTSLHDGGDGEQPEPS
ncbi:hypothetical protein RI054_20g89350 [Pseudoscourfieldia marina]